MIHLTDEEIQAYVLEPAACSEKIITHMRGCDVCVAVAEGYVTLFAGIKEQPAEGFDFDLEEVVLQRLEQGLLKWNFGWLAGIVSFSALLYFFRGYMAVLFTGIPSALLYFIIVTTGTIMFFLLADMYKSYQRKIRLLGRY